MSARFLLDTGLQVRMAVKHRCKTGEIPGRFVNFGYCGARHSTVCSAANGKWAENVSAIVPPPTGLRILHIFECDDKTINTDSLSTMNSRCKVRVSSTRGREGAHGPFNNPRRETNIEQGEKIKRDNLSRLAF